MSTTASEVEKDAPKENLSAALREAVEKIPNVTLTEKASYFRVNQGKVTLGYLYLGPRVPSAEIPEGAGKYSRISVKTQADLEQVVSAMQDVSKAAAEKAAAAPAETKKAPAKAAAKPKGNASKPDPKPSSKSRAKATA